MTAVRQAKRISEALDNPLDRALVGFMNRGKGKWFPRDLIMNQCGFDSPKEQPVGAYVQFHNSLIRANNALKPHGLRISMREDGAEEYSLMEVAP